MTRLWNAAAVLFVFGSACSFGVNPDEGRFSCDTVRDCGKGYECIDQVGSDRGLCFPVGACEPNERACDGKDEDCDGAVDDVSWAGVACVTDRPGVCGPGTRQCVEAVSVCVSDVEPSAEVCDGADNDCDGAVDEDFDLDSDQANCGACGVACPSGTTCRFTLCVPRETACGDRVDQDGDELVDCADPDCEGLACGDAGSCAQGSCR